MNEKRKQAIIRSIALAIESEQDAHEFIEELAKEDWGKRIKNSANSPARWTHKPCITCERLYLCGDGHLTGFCDKCWQSGRNMLAKLCVQRNRAKHAGLAYSLTLREWHDTLKYFNFLCAYCGGPDAIIIEHFIPMRQGGGTTKGNCIPACNTCNGKKGHRLPQDVAHKFPEGAIDRIRHYLNQFPICA